ncbi:T9SS type A sorting domain-containing protein [Spirosoma sp. SC4-14]|uniref:T9SS type A sorting domain-containing protein n=1 Tax=Spirosoma sp. SC4-14 TaxID=3128900 RepID=UPI0030D05BDB
MKTLIKSLAVAFSLALVTTLGSVAEAKPGHPANVASYKAGIYTTADGKLNIALDKQSGGAVDIRLKDTTGEVLYTHHIGKNDTKYRTRLNLSELPDGTYQVEITNGAETSSHMVNLSTQKPTTPSRVIALN